MKIVRRLGLVSVIAGLLALALATGLSSAGIASTPPDPDSCYCTRPDLSLSRNDVYWESYAAYQNRILSVDFEATNNSTNIANAHDMHVIGTVNTNGVVSSSLGRTINVVTAGECELFTMKYSVPEGVSSFRTEVHAETHDQCGNSYSYGGPMP